MFKVLMDYTTLAHVFTSYTVPEAIKVKANIGDVFDKINVPSNELLAKMRAEGISLSDFDVETKEIDMRDVAPSVLHRHIKNLFLNIDDLANCLNSFSLTQKIEARDYFTRAIDLLNLPSEELLAQLKAQGLIENQERVQQEQAKKLNSIRDKLNRATAEAPKPTLDELQVARTKALLNKKFSEIGNKPDADVLSFKAN
jgi:hypothetical protein